MWREHELCLDSLVVNETEDTESEIGYMNHVSKKLKMTWVGSWKDAKY